MTALSGSDRMFIPQQRPSVRPSVNFSYVTQYLRNHHSDQLLIKLTQHVYLIGHSY